MFFADPFLLGFWVIHLHLLCHSIGIYCGPLRLLAWEVAKRLNKAKVPCDLITGQEREEVEGAKHKSVTVEMADVTSEYHCAVIDEIQACEAFLVSFSFPSRHKLSSSV